jgi:hypothetical protein
VTPWLEEQGSPPQQTQVKSGPEFATWRNHAQSRSDTGHKKEDNQKQASKLTGEGKAGAGMQLSPTALMQCLQGSGLHPLAPSPKRSQIKRQIIPAQKEPFLQCVQSRKPLTAAPVYFLPRTARGRPAAGLSSAGPSWTRLDPTACHFPRCPVRS